MRIIQRIYTETYLLRSLALKLASIFPESNPCLRLQTCVQHRDLQLNSTGASYCEIEADLASAGTKIGLVLVFEMLPVAQLTFRAGRGAPNQLGIPVTLNLGTNESLLTGAAIPVQPGLQIKLWNGVCDVAAASTAPTGYMRLRMLIPLNLPVN